MTKHFSRSFRGEPKNYQTYSNSTNSGLRLCYTKIYIYNEACFVSHVI